MLVHSLRGRALCPSEQAKVAAEISTRVFYRNALLAAMASSAGRLVIEREQEFGCPSPFV